MKKNIGSQLALYPISVTVIGAMDGEKITVGQSVARRKINQNCFNMGLGLLECQSLKKRR